MGKNERDCNIVVSLRKVNISHPLVTLHIRKCSTHLPEKILGAPLSSVPVNPDTKRTYITDPIGSLVLLPRRICDPSESVSRLWRINVLSKQIQNPDPGNQIPWSTLMMRASLLKRWLQSLLPPVDACYFNKEEHNSIGDRIRLFHQLPHQRPTHNIFRTPTHNVTTTFKVARE